MAKNIGPKRKYERRFGLRKNEKRPRRAAFKKKSEYGKQLEEKQKLKFVYGILEKQMSIYADKALKSKEIAGEFLLRGLEMRLDNIVYRLGFASTRPQARQLVNHRHIFVDDKKINIPSYQTKPGQAVYLDEKISKNTNMKKSMEDAPPLPNWLERKGNIGKIVRLPNAEELPREADIDKVLGFYHRK